MRVDLGIDQLSVDADPVARSPNTSLKHIADAELAADPPRIDPLALIGERGIARDYEQVRNSRQIRRQILGDAVGEVLLRPVVAEVGKGQHDDRQAWRTGCLWDCDGTRCRECPRGLGPHAVDPHWPDNVLNLPLAQIFEGVIEPVPHLIPDYTAHADPAGFRQCLQPRGHINAVAEDVVLFNNYVA